jgi:PPOX class probable F420-dependent enzyme
MSQMTPAEIEQFLQAPRNAIITANTAGPPHVSPVWYIYEEGRLYFTISTRTAKYRHLRHDPRLSACVDGCNPDWRTVMLYGTVEFIEYGRPLEEEMFWRIMKRYYDTEAAAIEFGTSIRDETRVLAVMTVEKIVSQDLR